MLFCVIFSFQILRDLGMHVILRDLGMHVILRFDWSAKFILRYFFVPVILRFF